MIAIMVSFYNVTNQDMRLPVWNGFVEQNNVGFVENAILKGEKNLGRVPGTIKVVMKLHTLESPSPRQRSKTAMKTQVVDQNCYSCRGN